VALWAWIAIGAVALIAIALLLLAIAAYPRDNSF
jgi:hypothetical protein